VEVNLLPGPQLTDQDIAAIQLEAQRVLTWTAPDAAHDIHIRAQPD
jgi:hypothetical protein